MKPEFIDKLTASEILRLRIWSDLTVSGADTEHICPFRREWLEKRYSLGLSTKIELGILNISDFPIQCPMCREFISLYPKITKPPSDEIHQNCPCRRFKSMDLLIDALSEQLLKYKTLVNSKISKFKKEIENDKTNRFS